MIRISGAGCVLVDVIYADVDFLSSDFENSRSKRPGDGGLEPGKLVFTDDFDTFTGRPCLESLGAITQGRQAHATNIGGPGIVALINAAQLLELSNFEVNFVGAIGADEFGAELGRQLARTPLSPRGLKLKSGLTPFTYVLSDPRYANGRGERTFVNNIGTAWHLTPEDLDEDFFASDFVVFGGTGLVPGLHDHLDTLLQRAQQAGAFTLVNTVYDFRNEKRNPAGRWPLGSSDASYRFIDLLVADREEALRLSGESRVGSALDWFVGHGVGAAAVTDGVHDIEFRVSSPRFRKPEAQTSKVCQQVLHDLADNPHLKGDTTGCGDNFAGGLLTSLALQKERGKTLDLEEALRWASTCGGLACYHMGGVFHENFPGEKRQRVNELLATWPKKTS